MDLAKKSLINSKLESMDQASGMMAHEALNRLLSKPLTVEEWFVKSIQLQLIKLSQSLKKLKKIRFSS